MSRAIWTTLFAGLLAVSLFSGGHAQEQPRGKKYALLVGVKSYDHSALPDLKHTENDVEQLGKLLTSASGGFDEVIMLTSTRGQKAEAAKPTAANLRKQLKGLLDKVTKHDLVIVALAGHGLQMTVTDPTDEKKEREESFFCPSDARPRSIRDLKQLQKTMIPLFELFTELDDSGAGVKLLLVDACRNEPKQGRNLDIDNLPKPTRGTAALFSCKGGERAFESDKLSHGVFFHYVIKAMQGAARNDRGVVTWTRLAEYVVEQVSEEVPRLIGGGARQTPQELKNLEGKSPILVGVGRTVVKAPPVVKTAQQKLIDYLPDTTGGIVMLDAKQLLGSSLVKDNYLGQLRKLLEAKEAKDALTELKFDPLTDLHRMVIGVEMTKDGKQGHFALLIQGKFDLERLGKAMAAGATRHEVRTTDGRTRVYYQTQAKDANQSPQIFTLVNGEVFAFTDTRAGMEAILEREASGGAPRFRPAVAARIEAVNNGRTGWFFFMPELVKTFPQKDFTDQVEDFHGELVIKDDVALQLVFTIKDTQKADEFIKMFREVLKLMKESLDGKEVPAELRPLAALKGSIDAITIERQDRQIIGRAKVTQKVAVKLFDDLMAEMNKPKK